MNVLILNAGSSSLKLRVIAADLERIKKNEDRRLNRGQVERIDGEAIVTIQTQDGCGTCPPRGQQTLDNRGSSGRRRR